MLTVLMVIPRDGRKGGDGGPPIPRFYLAMLGTASTKMLGDHRPVNLGLRAVHDHAVLRPAVCCTPSAPGRTVRRHAVAAGLCRGRGRRSGSTSPILRITNADRGRQAKWWMPAVRTAESLMVPCTATPTMLTVLDGRMEVCMISMKFRGDRLRLGRGKSAVCTLAGRATASRCKEFEGLLLGLGRWESTATQRTLVAEEDFGTVQCASSLTTRVPVAKLIGCCFMAGALMDVMKPGSTWDAHGSGNCRGSRRVTPTCPGRLRTMRTGLLRSANGLLTETVPPRSLLPRSACVHCDSALPRKGTPTWQTCRAAGVIALVSTSRSGLRMG